MKQKPIVKLIYFFVMLIISCCVLGTSVFSAQDLKEEAIIVNVHEHVYVSKIIEPTCETEGYTTYTCACGDSYIENYVSAIGHSYNEWILTTNPTHNTHGIETRNCSICDKIEEREYICLHEKTIEKITDSTCTKEGSKETFCEFCGKLTNSETINIKEHEYSGWKTSINATPAKDGQQYKECTCGKTEYRTITFQKAGNTAIYIEGTGINHKMAITAFSQSAVDSNDICYTSSRLDSINPIVLGHNTGTLKLLPKTKVGSLIYLWIDGKEHVYKVVLSEKARDMTKDIVGVSGENLLKKYDTPHLHLYTCYKESTGEFTRWLVLAEKIS